MSGSGVSGVSGVSGASGASGANGATGAERGAVVGGNSSTSRAKASQGSGDSSRGQGNASVTRAADPRAGRRSGRLQGVQGNLGSSGAAALSLRLVRAIRDGILAAATVLGRLVMFWKFYGPWKPEHVEAGAAARPAGGDVLPWSVRFGRGFEALLIRIKQKVYGSIELRLPRAVVAMLAVGSVALMGLMYQLGQHTAESPYPLAEAGETGGTGIESNAVGSVPGRSEISGAVVAMGSLPLEPADVPGGAVTLSTGVPRSVVLPTRDPRAVGLNYFTLLAVPPDMLDEVRELQAYLAQNGLITYLDKTNSGRLRNLVDVTRGYSRNQLDTLEYAEHRYRIQALGQRYRKQNGGRGPDLSDIYPDRYDGPAAP